jgi:hypothetical protein
MWRSYFSVTAKAENIPLFAELALRPFQELDDVVITCERQDCRGAACRKRLEAQHRASDDAERAFGADEELAQIIAGVVLDHLVQHGQHGTVGERHFEAQNIVTGDAMADHADAAGIGRKIAADLAAAASAEIYCQEKTCRLGRLLRHLERRAGLDRHGLSRLVDLLDAGEALERQGEIAGLRAGAAGKAGEPALRHDALPMGIADAQGRRHGFAARRAQHRLGQMAAGLARIALGAVADIAAGQHGIVAERAFQFVDEACCVSGHSSRH